MNTTLTTPDGERHSVPVSVAILVTDLRQQNATLTKALAMAEEAAESRENAEVNPPADSRPFRPAAEPKAPKSR